MKNIKFLISVFIIASFVSSGVAQTYTAEKMNSEEIELIQNRYLHYMNAQKNTLNSISANATRIQQIGDQNNIYSNTRSNSSEISYTQIGRSNDIYNDASSNRIEENVLQVGANHNFTDINSNNSRFHAADVIQYGKNQNLIWLGSQNSISEKMLVSMKGQNQTVIVRNLNN